MYVRSMAQSKSQLQKLIESLVKDFVLSAFLLRQSARRLDHLCKAAAT